MNPDCPYKVGDKVKLNKPQGNDNDEFQGQVGEVVGMMYDNIIAVKWKGDVFTTEAYLDYTNLEPA